MPNIQQPRVVYVPQPVVSQPATPAVQASDNSAGTDSAGEKSGAEIRKENLLTRNRSRFGTITTSFRGLLSSGKTERTTKTLLGE
ncbi:MAG: hypothetical protein ACLFR0_03315 [Alphaproteobacteria bacterium]